MEVSTQEIIKALKCSSSAVYCDTDKIALDAAYRLEELGGDLYTACNP